jgi:hypothetical protein
MKSISKHCIQTMHAKMPCLLIILLCLGVRCFLFHLYPSLGISRRSNISLKTSSFMKSISKHWIQTTHSKMPCLLIILFCLGVRCFLFHPYLSLGISGHHNILSQSQNIGFKQRMQRCHAYLLYYFAWELDVSYFTHIQVWQTNVLPTCSN